MIDDEIGTTKWEFLLFHCMEVCCVRANLNFRVCSISPYHFRQSGQTKFTFLPVLVSLIFSEPWKSDSRRKIRLGEDLKYICTSTLCTKYQYILTKIDSIHDLKVFNVPDGYICWTPSYDWNPSLKNPRCLPTTIISKHHSHKIIIVATIQSIFIVSESEKRQEI